MRLSTQTHALTMSQPAKKSNKSFLRLPLFWMMQHTALSFSRAYRTPECNKM